MAKQTGLTTGTLCQLVSEITSGQDSGVTIKGRNAWSLDFSQDVVTGPDFESGGFTEKFQGLRDASGSIGGFVDPTDTDGLKEIYKAFFNGTEKGLKLWLDSTHYVYCEVLFTGPAFDIPLEDMQSADIDFEVSNIEESWLLAAFD